MILIKSKIHIGNRLVKLFLITIALSSTFTSIAQKEIIIADLDKYKPEKFQNKTLKSEKTGEKKFTLPRRIIQNTVTRYNYYFNANRKLENVIDRAKIAQKDNFLKLLSYYPYSLNTTAAQRTELDSVIYKSTAGILLHDLRNNWVDDLYFLIGQAYYLRKDFDSAAMAFQFINFNLAPKKKYDDDAALVGSNDNSNGLFSIANKEKKGFTITKKPVRNDAILWQARTLIALGDYPAAGGLLNTLENDPNFPARLRSQLNEVYGYLYYQQQLYDSAASHLSRSFSSVETRQEKARKEFLIGQLYELSRQPLAASKYYNYAAANTTDPLMDIYASLYNIRLFKGTNEDQLNDNVVTLLLMAKRSRFENFRDIVYFSAAELAAQIPDTVHAAEFYKKSIASNTDNSTYKNKAYFKLANLEYNDKHYKLAAMDYDSIDVNDASMIDDAQFIIDRKKSLTGVVKYTNIIEREDSLQKISFMTPGERQDFLRKLLKQIRKQNGLKEDANYTSAAAAFNKTSNSSDIFAGNANNNSDWYFDNTSLKSKGYSEFKSKWGKRENTDNWRKQEASSGLSNRKIVSNPDNVSDVSITDNGINPANSDITKGLNPLIPSDLTYDGLLANVPITPEKFKISNTALAAALYNLGYIYSNSIEDYPLAASTLERALLLAPDSLYGGQMYSNLYYDYQKIKNPEKAKYYKTLLESKFNSSSYTQSILHPVSNNPALKNPEASKSYENIYNHFIEGDFNKAIIEKKVADSLYGNSYWNPQLLYIEAVYYIKQRQDSEAIVILNKIVTLYPKSPLKSKSENLLNVVKRRSEIESYLTNLKVDRQSDTVLNILPKSDLPAKLDVPAPSPAARLPIKNPEIPNSIFTISPADPQNVIMILDKVDGVYLNEAKNALDRFDREKFAAASVTIKKESLNKDKSLLVFTSFKTTEAALAFLSAVKSAAPNEVSWLPPFKYSFIIISDANLQLLKANQNLPAYMDVLKKNYPAQFK
ncbi:MAG: hypothetical protein NVSMB45_10040 [Ginsengibacter sp.]